MSSSYFSVVREMCQAPIMLLWWLQNIEEDKQEEAADDLRIWLKQFPNTTTTHRCGDWHHSRGFIRSGYKIEGLKITPEKAEYVSSIVKEYLNINNGSQRDQIAN